MIRRTRTIIFFLFIFIFLITTPLVILYATGYKINLSWPLKINTAIQKTGALHIDTKPNEATLYIDNKVKQKFINKYFTKNDEGIIRTPAKLKNIIPGEYDVKLTLEGYWPWQKKLEIKPGQTTFAEDIILFKKELPLLIKNAPLLVIYQSPSKKYLALVSDQLYIINSNDDSLVANFDISTELLSSKEKAEVKWSKDEKLILFDNKLFDIDKQTSTNLELDVNQDIYNTQFDQENNNIIYFQENNNLYQYNIDQQEKTKLINDKNIKNYYTKNNNIIFISENNNLQKLQVYSIENNKIISEIDLPFSQYYKFVNHNNKFINLYNEKHQILYLIDPFTPINPLKEIINNIKYSQWLEKDKFFYANNFEIWMLDLELNQKKLITRISQPINGILWHSSNNYIIYGTNQNINIIELDNREKRNITEIINLDNINFINIDEKNEALYFSAKIGNQEGLYKMYIK